uniref:Predicted protein n=1 Tax=Hordeum vulgare subsp. vulgare TaxID=112509 RepID=F2CWK6_HORVV|nr:predicted protein [Hordeum vulgare subsp. vulgare]
MGRDDDVYVLTRPARSRRHYSKHQRPKQLQPEYCDHHFCSSLPMTMEMFLPAILSDLLGRSVSFVVQRYLQQGSAEDGIRQLHLALLRVGVTVEEAEGRRITNQAMLRQLDALREAMYGGHYMLDALTCGRGDVADDDAPAPSGGFSSVLSRLNLNPAKRLCLAWSTGADGDAEVRRVVDRLGSMIADMKEFVVFLNGYPRVCRQPYSAHLLLERLMFGRQREMEQIISFLLRQGEAEYGVGVLPVVGPARIGKSTLVEHVCHDDRVRNHFSSILLMSGDDLEDEKLNDPGDHGLIKHHGRASHSHKRSLVIVELAGDEVPDEGRWRRLRSSAFCKGAGSRIIVTSRSEAADGLGTERALRLKVLSPEAYWHHFKTLAFGGANPEEHPRLVAIAMDICTEEKGSFIGANIACSLLRANLDARSWRGVLRNMREYTERHRHLFGKHPHDLLRKDRHVYLWRLAQTSKVFVSYGCYQARPEQEDAPRMTLQEVLSGRPAPSGRFEALAWRSQIPPCYSYLMSCSVQTPTVPHILARKKSSRLVV